MLRLYRAALWLLPPAFRRAYGASLAADAESRMSEAESWAARWVEGMRLAWDLVRALIREWADAGAELARDAMGAGMAADLRQAVRSVLRAPAFTAAVVGTLGLGIGATTVALGLVDTYLLRSLPYPEGGRLVVLWPSENWSREMIERARERMPSMTGVAGAGGTMLVLAEGGEPEEVFASQATTDLHDVLGVMPALGRGFRRNDGLPGAEPVAILSHRLWMDRFGGDREVIGRRVELGGEGHLRRTVIGVMPNGYLPLEGDGVDVWIPVVMDPSARGYDGSYFMRSVARLAPGAGPDDALGDLRILAARMGALHPDWFTEARIARATAIPLAHDRSADRRTPVMVALAASLLVLLVACANVANLVVARTTGRERELSVRAALGAGRLRTARAVLAEVVVLAAAGSALGTTLAYLLVRALERWFPQAIPDWGMQVDVRWIAVTGALAVLAALAAGLFPALHAVRRDPARAMAGGRGVSGQRRLSRLQEALSAGQLALSTAGIAAMGLLGRSLLQLNQVDPGFAPAHAITFRVTAPPFAYPEDADVTRFFREVRAALAGVPGVETAGLASRLPLDGGDSRITVTPEGWEFEEGDAHPVAWHRLITPGYLEAIGARLVSGRIPTEEDDRDDLPERVVVNRAAAEAYWPGEPAVGKRFYGEGGSDWLTVAGVVEDVMENGQTRPVLPALYVPHRDWARRSMYAVARAHGDPSTLMPELKRAVWSVSAGAPISRVETLDRVARRGLKPTRTLVILAGIAGVVTLLMGALGIYGVVNHAVVRRARELGVRAALGAGRVRLMRGELAAATRIVGLGLTVGLLLAWLTGHALRGALYDVGTFDAPSFGGALVLLTGVAYLAAWVPARRASTVDPATVMREE